MCADFRVRNVKISPNEPPAMDLTTSTITALRSDETDAGSADSKKITNIHANSKSCR